MKVFIAYASEDRKVAESIAFSIRSRGHEVFFDRDDLPVGASYDQQIELAVKQSDLFIFLISPDSVTNGAYTLTELAFSRKKWPDPNGRVLPVIVRQTPRTDVPPYLTAVTILEPRGNIAAETSAEVDSMSMSTAVGSRSKHRNLQAAIITSVIGIFLGIIAFLGIPAIINWEASRYVTVRGRAPLPEIKPPVLAAPAHPVSSPVQSAITEPSELTEQTNEDVRKYTYVISQRLHDFTHQYYDDVTHLTGSADQIAIAKLTLDEKLNRDFRQQYEPQILRLDAELSRRLKILKINDSAHISIPPGLIDASTIGQWGFHLVKLANQLP